MTSKTKIDKNRVAVVVIATLLLFVGVSTICNIIMRLYSDYTNDWSVCFTNAAHIVYRRGENINSLPEHSLNGFPKYYYVLALFVGLDFFLILKVCLKIKSKASIVCSIIVFSYLVLLISFAAFDYYKQDYRSNVKEAYLFHYNRWWQEDHSDDGIVADIRKELDNC